MPYLADVRIMPALIRLHECLCAELEKSGLGVNCDCALVHGNSTNVAPPAVGHGYALIGLQSIFPSKDFPSATGGRDSCPAPLAATISVGLIRCYAVKVKGESSEEMLLYMDKQMADMAAMRRAIVCCNQEFEDMGLGIYLPIGPEGGTYGGQWVVTIGEVIG